MYVESVAMSFCEGDAGTILDVCRDESPSIYIYIYEYMSMCHLIGALKYGRGSNLEKGTA